MIKNVADKTKKRALVTGATGYIGYHLAKRLLQDGWQVHVLLREKSDIRKLKDLNGQVSVFRYDGKSKKIISALQQAQPDFVFHLAAKVFVDHRLEEMEDIVHANILLGVQLLEGMTQLGIRFFINTGSYWQHYEGKPKNPVNFYAATKQSFEDILCLYAGTGKIRALTLKLFDVYGPGDTRPKIFSLFERCAQSGEPLAMSPGEQLLDLVYIDDTVEAFCRAAHLLETEQAGTLEASYAVTSSKHLSLRDVAAMYQRLSGRELKIVWGGRPYRNREVMVPWKGTPLPGWTPRVDLENGIRNVIAPSNLSQAAKDQSNHSCNTKAVPEDAHRD
ncbi:MAG: NAD(P)-dependent oxidoreductase [Candidatus Omnitrophica bacterium]|nr:NAD(P)-dependent oxidoreductase [Candidatus Omnitrophota bacterium]MDD5671059.1 NAD(P)-dependent oxidoreductase [Candidatus Omnitrophota bacterium]